MMQLPIAPDLTRRKIIMHIRNLQVHRFRLPVLTLAFLVLIGLFAWRSAAPLAAATTGPSSTESATLAAPIESTAQDTSAQAYQPSVALLWNEVMLAAIRNGPPRPTVTARNLLIVHQAMYDAWSLYDPRALPSVLSANLRRPEAEHTDEYKAAAVSAAAYHTLLAVYPDYETKSGAYSRLLQALGYAPVDLPDTSPAGVGLLAAQAVLADRVDDGSNAENNFADVASETYPALYAPINSGDLNAENGVLGVSFDPNRWEPLWVPTGVAKNDLGYPIVDAANPASYKEQVYLTPHWGAVRPFALSDGAQFRPPAPPKQGSDAPYVDGLGRAMTNDAAYNMQVDEILHISANLTDRQKVIAEYWADGPRSETPPGHWNALAHGIAERDHHTLDQDVKLFLALNGALFDAGIAAWDAKRAYDCVRPVSAIRYRYKGQMVEAWAGPNLGTQWISGETWLPYQDPTFVTPPFAEYVSGHSTFSAAAATVLTEFTGSNRFYDGKTILYHEDFNRDGIPDLLGQHVVAAGANMFESSPASVVVLQWETFQEAANEAGASRRYGGIHFQDGDLRGREMGRNIGVLAFDVAQGLWTGESAQ
jgi:hypothetical protein